MLQILNRIIEFGMMELCATILSATFRLSAVKNIVALLGQGFTLVLLVVLYDSLHAFLRLTNDRRVAPLYKFDLPNQRFGVSLILSESSLHLPSGSGRSRSIRCFASQNIPPSPLGKALVRACS